MKKLISVIALSALLLNLTGCHATQATETNHSDKLNIVCTGFSEYDWTKKLLGSHADDVNLIYLLNNGMDLHNYQPSAKDMITISECDVFIYTGSASENWVNDALREVTNANRQVINLMDIVSVKEEEQKEGMQIDEHAHEQEENSDYDEHVWLSVKNAEMICDTICNVLCELDSEHAQDYQKNLSNYQEELNILDKNFTQLAEESSVKTLIFADRFPFRYFADDYGFDYYAVFTGCSTETEASFETILFLAQKIDELHAETIFKIENSSDAIAKSIIASTSEKNQTIMNLNSMQSVNTQDIANGASYLSIMQDNLATLQEVLT
ncbi:MAG: metal ABC transporter substrate-binding protein [Oscillospiraceae bacterium]|nr:metal ABC transporter substrate-binding protein [Oscillospiraceae bacterium]